MLKEHAENLDFKIDSLVESVQDLNETLVTETPTRLADMADTYGHAVTSRV